MQPAVAARGVMRDDDGTGGDGEGAQAKELLVRVGEMRERDEDSGGGDRWRRCGRGDGGEGQFSF